MKFIAPLLLAAFAFALPAQGQSADQYMELLRSDLRAEKVAIVTVAMNLDDAQSEKFWPIYRDYEKDVAELGDKWISGIKEYAANYMEMTDEKADELMTGSMKLTEERLQLHKKYYKNVKKELGGVVAARFVQVERRLGMLIELQAMAEIPLVEHTATGK